MYVPRKRPLGRVGSTAATVYDAAVVTAQAADPGTGRL